MNDDPVGQGMLAAADGKQLSDNPFPEDSEEYVEWAEGWHYFHNEDENGKPLEDA